MQTALRFVSVFMAITFFVIPGVLHAQNSDSIAPKNDMNLVWICKKKVVPYMSSLKRREQVLKLLPSTFALSLLSAYQGLVKNAELKQKINKKELKKIQVVIDSKCDQLGGTSKKGNSSKGNTKKDTTITIGDTDLPTKVEPIKQLHKQNELPHRYKVRVLLNKKLAPMTAWIYASCGYFTLLSELLKENDLSIRISPVRITVDGDLELVLSPRLAAGFREGKV